MESDSQEGEEEEEKEEATPNSADEESRLFGIENENKINDLIQNLYGLHGNINSYLSR